MSTTKWIVQFNFDLMPRSSLPSEQAKIILEHFDLQFGKLEPLLIGNLRCVKQWKNILSVVISGPEEECQNLKKLVLGQGIGTMETSNKDIVFGANK